MNPNIVIHKILEANVPATGIDGEFYYTDKGNLYIVNSAGNLVKQTDVVLVTVLPGVGITNKLYLLTTEPSFNYYDGAVWHKVMSNNNGTVTSVESSNDDITVTTGTSTAVLTINTGLAANQILKLDVNAKITADILEDGTVNKAYTAEEKTKLGTVAEGATKVEDSTTNGNILVNSAEVEVYALPIATQTVLGGVKQGLNTEIDAEGKINVNISGAGHNIQGEGIAVTPQVNLNFTGGGVTVTDDPDNNATLITVEAALIDDEAALDDMDHTYSVKKITALNNTLRAIIGDMETFEGSNDSSVVAALNELKSSIVTAVTAAGMSYDNQVTGLSAVNVQAAIDQLFTYANNFKNSLAGVIGEPSVPTETFAQLASDIQSYKTILAATLSDKGVPTVSSESLNSMVAKVDQVIGSSMVTQVKLNVSAPYTKVITFTNPINIANLCSSIITYTAGLQGIVEYLCNFNNGDSTNFNVGSNVVFDGLMKLSTRSLTGNCSDMGAIGSGKLWTSPVLDDTIFHTIDTITYTDAEVPTFSIAGTNFPAITLANNDINLTGIYELTGLNWTSNTSGTGVALLVMSVDSGTTWYGFDGALFNSININDLADIKAKGTTKAIANAMTLGQLETLRNNSTVIRFGYYLEMNNINDVANTDAIQLTVSMPGTNTITPSTDYTQTISADGTTLTYVFSVSGTYTINYVDNATA